MKISALSVASATLLLLCAFSFSTAAMAQQAAPDNSKENKNQRLEADNQPNATSDRTVTAKVRRAIVADKGLSVYAHNVKVITLNGQVTLKGPVRSDEERQRVASDAASVVSNGNLSNQLTVKQ